MEFLYQFRSVMNTCLWNQNQNLYIWNTILTWWIVILSTHIWGNWDIQSSNMIITWSFLGNRNIVSKQTIVQGATSTTSIGEHWRNKKPFHFIDIQDPTKKATLFSRGWFPPSESVVERNYKVQIIERNQQLPKNQQLQFQVFSFRVFSL